MAMNFCHPQFQARIHCDKVSTDGYEAENLISGKSCGYMAERFIKPPVNIVIEFPCNVEVHHILVNTVIGAQKTIGIEILSQSARKRNFWLSASTQKTETSQASTDGIFSPLGRLFTDKPKYFCFINRRFRKRPPYSSLEIPELPLDCVQTDLRSHNNFLLCNASHFMVRLLRTSDGGIPVLGSIQVWGQPAASCGTALVRTILDIYNTTTDQQQHVVGTHDKNKPLETKAHNPPQNRTTMETMSLAGKDIPMDFIDPITCEVMSLPVLLPSGHTIDQSTLDKHVAAESSWGRSPSDLFTGVLFSQSNKPVPNNALKARIDKYLLDTGLDITEVARTVGRRKGQGSWLLSSNPLCSGPQTGCSVQRPSTSNHAVVLSLSHSQTKKSTSSQSNCAVVPSPSSSSSPLLTKTSTSSQSKHALPSSHSHCKTTMDIKLEKRNERYQSIPSCDKLPISNITTTRLPSLVNSQKRGREEVPIAINKKFKQDSCISSPCKGTSGNWDSDSVSHEQHLNYTLDEAINDTLSCLPSYRKKPARKETELVKTGCCSDCGIVIKTGYILTCKHLICRNCLLASVEKMCKVCHSKWRSEEVTKVHVA